MPVPVFTAGEILTAANMNKVGLWLVSSGSLTAVSNNNYLRIQNAFSASFSNYRLVINGTGSAVSNLTLKLGNSGTPSSTAYSFAIPYWYVVAGADGVVRSGLATSSYTCGFFNTSRTSGSLDIFNPQKEEVTIFAGSGIGQENPTFGYVGYSTMGVHNVATAYTELFIGTSGTATFTGTYALYGYRD